MAVLLLSTSLWAGTTYLDRAETVAIDPERGVDPRVDYEALVAFGPWDDRNYRLTLEDLGVLAADEAKIHQPIPAWFRVKLRQARPELTRDGTTRYPLTAFNIFRQQFGGYKINGDYYRKLTRDNDRYYVILEPVTDPGEPTTDDVITGESRITSPNGASESAIAINPANTDQVIAGTNGPSGGQRMHWSDDGGATWTQVDLPLGSTCCDPAVEWSSDGQFAYTVTLGSCSFFGGCGLWFYRSDDGGQTWTDLEDVTPGDPRREVANGADREYMHVDKFGGSPFTDNIYLTWHNGNVLQFAVSTDFGNTFTNQAFDGASDNRGIAGDITTDKDGVIYYAYPAFNSRTIRLTRSSNGGVTFDTIRSIANTNASFNFPLPSMEAREVALYTAMDVDRSDGPFANSVYMAWPDITAPDAGANNNHAQVFVAYSRDGGDTWNTSIPHETADVLTVDRWQPFLMVGQDGTVHVVFYDTRRSADRTAVDLFYAFSTDGAVTWSAPQRVTTEMSPNINDGFEYGDYLGMDMVMDDLIAIFTDNRSEDGSGGDSIDVYAAGITPGGAFCGNNTQEAGEACDGVDFGGLTCADFGCSGGNLTCPSDCSGVDTSSCTGCAASGSGSVLGGRGVPGTPLLVNRSGNDLVLTWAGACNAADDYAIYEGAVGNFGVYNPVQCSTGGSTSATITPGAGDRFLLVTPLTGGAEGSYGLRSDDSERPVSGAACATQNVVACP
ncbi:hypothetical protein ABI59_10180 [Acidobacteria bacterium Mor1]|nr:hypothetical protein ABI59_10180 [Acidobacteria bacterium Mor1]